MVKFAKDAQVATGTKAEAGEYKFRVYEVNEKTSRAGNDYWQVKFETQDGVKVCDNFMFFGKAATKTLGLLTGLGLADGENFPTDNLEPDDILGKFVIIEVEEELDENKKPTGYLRCPFNIDKYKVVETKKKKSETSPWD